MKITWLGWAGVEIEHAGASVVVDPLQDARAVFAPLGEHAEGTPAPEVIAAYNAPFPDDSYKAAARQFPLLVPITPDDPAAAANRAAWEVLRRWQKPLLTAFSDSDAVTRGGERVFQKLVPGAQGQPHVTITGAGHFLQEDKGEELAQVVADFIARTK